MGHATRNHLHKINRALSQQSITATAATVVFLVSHGVVEAVKACLLIVDVVADMGVEVWSAAGTALGTLCRSGRGCCASLWKDRRGIAAPRSMRRGGGRRTTLDLHPVFGENIAPWGLPLLDLHPNT